MFTKKDKKINMRRGEVLLVTVTILMVSLAIGQIYHSNFMGNDKCEITTCENNNCETKSCADFDNENGNCHK